MAEVTTQRAGGRTSPRTGAVAAALLAWTVLVATLVLAACSGDPGGDTEERDDRASEPEARPGPWPEPPEAPVQNAVLRDVEHWFYFLDVNLDEDTVDEIAASAYELVVLDFIPSEQQNTDYPMREVTDWLHDSHDGRLVLAYIDIGQAESFRTYWQSEWGIGDPVWIAGGDPDGWEGNFPVAFWHDEWREIWLGDGGYLEGVLGHGFDGVYLDWVEAYSDENVLRVANDDGVDAREEMVAWVADIAEFGRNRRPGFIVMAQNASELAEDPEYLAIIDAIAQEQVWFDGSADNDPPGDCPLPRTEADVDSDAYYDSLSQDCQRQFDEFPDSTLHVSSEGYLHYLELAREAGLPVLTVDYAVEPGNVAWVYRESRSHGFVPFASNRALDQFVEPRDSDLGGNGDASETRGRSGVSPSIVQLTCSGPQFSQTVGDLVSCSVQVAGEATSLETAEGADPDVGT